VGFYDNDLVLTMIDTLVDVGQSNDDPDHGRMWLFTQPDASPNSEQDGTADDAPALIAFSDKQLHAIVDFSVISLEGPVEMVDGELAILIPLEAGGAALAPLARESAKSTASSLKSSFDRG